ncbi:MAG: hypothetical protein Q9226_003490 [Calogaya cf. arnoldii]
MDTLRNWSSKRKRNDTDPRGESPAKILKEQNGLFVLADKPSDEPGVVDVVAVHGLGGDAYTTWQDEGKLWLQDFIPSQITNTRVMSYGYDSLVAFSKSVAGVEDFAADLLNRLNDERSTAQENLRPVVFICHSLGGIVFKKALVLAHQRSTTYSNLLDRVQGVMFLGTPHRGSDVAYWMGFVARAFQTAQLGTGTNSKLLEALEKNSSTLSNISQEFVERGAGLKIRTFYETEKMDYMNSLVVTADSARLNLPNEKLPVPIQANHRTMCKFADASSQKYRPVWKALSQLVEAAKGGPSFAGPMAIPNPVAHGGK